MLGGLGRRHPVGREPLKKLMRPRNESRGSVNGGGWWVGGWVVSALQKNRSAFVPRIGRPELSTKYTDLNSWQPFNL